MSTELEVGSRWSPIAPEEVAELFEGAAFFWALAGGYAVERFVGETFRQHADIDIVVLRRDQLALQEQLRGWRLFAVDPPGSLRPWLVGELLPASVHDVWVHREGRDRWELQVMIQESEGESWVFRRDRRIRGAIAGLASSCKGIPCMRMDLQMLYKSQGRRAKDELDFARVRPKLTQVQCTTLAAWLSTANPGGHEWTARLAT